MDVCRKVVTRSGLDIDMSFGVDKCAVFITRKEKLSGHCFFIRFQNYQVKIAINT